MKIDNIVKESLESTVVNLDLSMDRYEEMLNYIEKEGDQKRNSIIRIAQNAAEVFFRRFSLKDFVEVAVFILILIAIPIGVKHYSDTTNLKPPVIINKDNEDIDGIVESNEGVLKYFPQKRQTLVYNGGFENEGWKLETKISKDGKLQINRSDTAVAGTRVYKISENEIRLIYFVGELPDGADSKSFIDMEPNANEIVLKAPIEKGTKWSNEDGSQYEITGVDLKISTPAGAYEAIEVTRKSQHGEQKIFNTKTYNGMYLVLPEKYPGDGHSSVDLFLIDEKLEVISWTSGETPISMCFTVNKADYNGNTILFGSFNDTKWDFKKDIKVKVQIDKVE